jgi:glutathione S-transferase
MDSKAIALAIEEKYPTPPMPINAPVHPRFIASLRRAMTELRPVFITQVPKNVIGEASVPYFRETREKNVGMTLEKLENDNPVPECFRKASPALQEVTELLKEDTSGPFLQGSQVVYSDIVLASMLLFFQSMGEDVFEELLKSTGDREVFEKFLEVMRPWTERNDH